MKSISRHGVGATRLRWIVLGVLVALFAISSPQAAIAHDYVDSTSPAEGEAINRALEEVIVTFSQPPLEGLAGSSLIVVTTDEGETVSGETTTIEGRQISVPVEFAGPGTYTVAWKSVSSDGHTISETYDFVWNSNGATTASPTSTPATSESPEESATPPTSARNTSTESSDGGWIRVVVVTAIVLVLLVPAIIFVYRAQTPLTDKRAPKKRSGDDA